MNDMRGCPNENLDVKVAVVTVEPSALAAGSQAPSLNTVAGGLHASQRLLQPRFIQQTTQQLDSGNTGEWRASFVVHRSFQQ
jgi:hypothetical protein